MAVFQALDHETPEVDLNELRNLAATAAATVCGDGSSEAIEVGSWTGRTALVLEEYFQKVFCVDTFEGNPNDRLGDIARHVGKYAVRKAFCDNMGPKLFTSIFPIFCDSSEAAVLWPRKVAMVFIDANHDYESVKLDIKMWNLHVLTRGFLCGHDYGVFEGVTRAVNELIPADQLRIEGTVWSTRCR